MNLNEIWVDEHQADDVATVWAATHEFELRELRYRRYLEGGLSGVVVRITAHLEAFQRALSGVHYDERVRP